MPETLRSLLIDNPMLEEAGRARRRFFRTGDTPRVVNYVALGLITLFYLWVITMIVRIHEDMVDFLLTLEVLTVTGVVVASVYGAVAAEREKATWDALIITQLTPAQILVGKVLWRLAIAGFVIGMMSLPVSLSSMYRRSAADPELGPLMSLVVAHLIVLAWAIFLAAFTLFVSARSRRSVSAMAVVTGSLLGALLLVPMLLSMFGFRVDYIRPETAIDIPGWIWLHLNPFFLLATYDQQVYLYSEALNAANAGIDTPFFVRHWRELVPLIYLGGACVFFWGAWLSLRRIEEPKRRSDI